MFITFLIRRDEYFRVGIVGVQGENFVPHEIEGASPSVL